jgi:hypothetical protein
LNNNNKGVDEDWGSWKRKYKGRSPLYQEIIESYRIAGLEQRGGGRVFLDFANKPDAKKGSAPVHWASIAGRNDELQALLAYGADPFAISHIKRGVLHFAAEGRNEDTMEFLLGLSDRIEYREKLLDIDQADSWGERPLHIASSQSASCTALLLRNGAR